METSAMVTAWNIGDVEIFPVVEIEAGPLIQRFIRNAVPERIRAIEWLSPHFADEQGRLRAVVQGFLVKSDGKNLLIDTGIGNGKDRTDIPEWGNLGASFQDSIAKLGI